MNTEQTNRKKRYYQKNREKILKSLKEKRRPAKQKSISIPLGQVGQQIFSYFQLNIEKLLLGLLVLCCTAFLIAESTRTLDAIEGAGAIWKALLCELVLLGVSMLAAPTRQIQFIRSVVLVGVVGLTLLNTIGGPLTQFSQSRQSARMKTEETLVLRNTIEQKQTILTRYLATNRISRARRIELEVSALSDRLGQLQREQSVGKPESALALGLAIMALMRLVILAANAIFANRLGQLLRNRTVQFHRGVSTRPKLFVVRT